MTDFEALDLSAPLLRALEQHGFDTPTEIQRSAIPPLLQGQDLIGLAETGTGKTAAFLLPMLERLLTNPAPLAPGSPRALVLAPTRELAQQIGDALNALSSNVRLRTTVVYGGTPMNKQLTALKAGTDVLIATPGRLMDHERRGSVRFDQTEIFILDEADRMLDMGFVNDVKSISRALPDSHQTVLFSATINKSVEGLTKELLTDPVRVDLARKICVSGQIEHRVMHARQGDKKSLLKKILQDQKTGQTIIFTKTKRGADKLARDLVKTGFRTDVIHGDRSQRQRQKTLSRFRNGTVGILIATDVAARGIDVPGIARVVNYDLPLEPEAYVHRLGRTGRNGATGTAVSLCTPDDIALLWGIEKLLEQTIAVDSDHEFHLDPPLTAAKQQRRQRRSRPQRRFKERQATKAGGKPSRKGKATVDGAARPAKRAKPQRKSGAPLRSGKPVKAKKRASNSRRRAA